VRLLALQGNFQVLRGDLVFLASKGPVYNISSPIKILKRPLFFLKRRKHPEE
jgi:hypothetical protein